MNIALLKTYFWVFLSQIKEQTSTPITLVFEGVVVGIWVFILILLYKYAYTQAPSDLPISLEVAVWSIGIYFIVFAFELRRIFRFINEDIKNGSPYF